jgi:AraC-like DNA-binding protein
MHFRVHLHGRPERCFEMARFRAMARMNGDQHTCAAFWVKGVAETLKAAGFDVAALLDEAGLDMAALSDPDARFPTERVSLLWQLAVARSGNPAIGLSTSNVVRPASFDVVAYTMMSSPNLLGILKRVVRYVGIVSDAASLAVTEDHEGCGMTLELFGGGQPVPRQRFEFDLITFLSFCRWVTNRDLRPLALELRFPPPADLHPYHNAFKCPLRFNARANALLFARADVISPLPTAHPLLAEVHERLAAEHLQRLDHAQTSGRARAALIRHLPHGEPRRKEIARILEMSERTLQRRLGAEGTSFQRLVDDTRRDLSQQYLGQPNLSLADAAYLLGFGDRSSFFRASKRWFGTSPRQHRIRLMGARLPGS